MVLRLEREWRADLSGFVLRDFMLGVLLAFLPFAIGPAGFGDVHLWRIAVSKWSNEVYQLAQRNATAEQ